MWYKDNLFSVANHKSFYAKYFYCICKIIYSRNSYFADSSPVLAISVPYCAMDGLLNLANIQARNYSSNDFCVCLICSVCV